MSDKTIVTDADGNVVTVTKAPTRVFVDFTRTVNLGDYNSAKASVNFECVVPLDASDEDLADSVRSGFLVAKTAVFEQLGLQYNLDTEFFIARENLEAAGLGAVEVSQVQEQAAVQAATTRAANTPAAKTSDKNVARANLLDAIAGEWDKNGPKGWFDNRENKRSPKAPDFKARTTNRAVEANTALWIDKDDEVQGALVAAGR